MQRSTAQKILLVLSILAIIGAVLMLITSIMALVGGSLVASSGETFEGMTSVEAGGLVMFFGVYMLIAGIVELIEGILGVRAANDHRKIMPVWVLAVIGLVCNIIGLILAVMSGQTDPSSVASALGGVVCSGLFLWLANTIKQEAHL